MPPALPSYDAHEARLLKSAAPLLPTAKDPAAECAARRASAGFDYAMEMLLFQQGKFKPSQMHQAAVGACTHMILQCMLNSGIGPKENQLVLAVHILESAADQVARVMASDGWKISGSSTATTSGRG
jgi:hypothetical protein